MIVKELSLEENIPKMSPILTFLSMDCQVVAVIESTIGASRLHIESSIYNTSKARGRAFLKWERMMRRISEPFTVQAIRSHMNIFCVNNKQILVIWKGI